MIDVPVIGISCYANLLWVGWQDWQGWRSKAVVETRRRWIKGTEGWMRFRT
jgi:hypothetical protein